MIITTVPTARAAAHYFYRQTAMQTLRFGTRGSALALWQTRYVMGLLTDALPGQPLEMEIIRTRDDSVADGPPPLLGGKGLFTAELEAALHEQRIDFAVHSLKDLPTDLSKGLIVGATPRRANPADALISRAGYTLMTLPEGARIGTSSHRRGAQLLHRRPDLRLVDIQGNIDTRLRKALSKDGGYDAILLACAGLERLGYTQMITQVLDLEDVLPAPGQGAIAVQTRDDPVLLQCLSSIHDEATNCAVTAERAFLAGLGGGCSVPVAAFAHRDGKKLYLHGRVLETDGSRQIEVSGSTAANTLAGAAALGHTLADAALRQGAGLLLAGSPAPGTLAARSDSPSKSE